MRARSRRRRKNIFDRSGPLPEPTSDQARITALRMNARIQKAAYVTKRVPFSGSNFFTAVSNPTLPSAMRSARRTS